MSVNDAERTLALDGIAVMSNSNSERSSSRGGCSLAVVTVVPVDHNCSKSPLPSPSRAVPSAAASREIANVPPPAAS